MARLETFTNPHPGRDYVVQHTCPEFTSVCPKTGHFATSSNAFVLVDGTNTPRYPPIAGADGAAALPALEVQSVLQEALDVANRARAQLRRPLGDAARGTVSVVDTNGAILGIVRSRDAPVLGADVSLQKARSAAFLSGQGAATDLASLGGAPARYLSFPESQLVQVTASVNIPDYAAATDAFLGLGGAFGSGTIAFSARAIGNLARPFFPDGLHGSPHGPFSKPAGEWSPFSTGLQLDLGINAILQHVLFVATNPAPPAGIDRYFFFVLLGGPRHSAVRSHFTHTFNHSLLF